ncbi:hypothetical protein J23TS9_32630 [Paenibacillus sp. J23TS9]|uniref:DUF6609 family protein n=1 Tax=Paenibacillus sp. J23TS9 TaxID=2807193 RepID=UPI001B231693|nr:DUF6609 family protein [Paenibacillus sp. J23TS9]GIP28133.1 hypothetical protein J23TS9_32630 [Paenibacillus sp. J23TS9]
MEQQIHMQNRKIEFLNKRVCGAWLIWVALVIFAGLMAGGQQLILMPVFSFGYVIGIFGILGNKMVNRKLSYGRPSVLQKRMLIFSIILMFVLMVLIGGPHFGNGNYRLIWLGAFLAIGIHFIPMSWVHGPSMIVMAALLTADALYGILDESVSFHMIAYIDIGIKLVFGIYLLFSGKPAYAEHHPGAQAAPYK